MIEIELILSYLYIYCISQILKKEDTETNFIVLHYLKKSNKYNYIYKDISSNLLLI